MHNRLVLFKLLFFVSVTFLNKIPTNKCKDHLTPSSRKGNCRVGKQNIFYETVISNFRLYFLNDGWDMPVFFYLWWKHNQDKHSQRFHTKPYWHYFNCNRQCCFGRNCSFPTNSSQKNTFVNTICSFIQSGNPY